MTDAYRVDSRGALRELRQLHDLDQVIVETPQLKYRGLMPLAVRYALWAVREGGVITLLDDGPEMAGVPPYDVPFNALRFVASRFLGRDTALLEWTRGRLVLARTTPVLSPGWSAGIVFSGTEAEIPTLRSALAALARQPELTPEHGGEILVCGPSRNTDFLADFPHTKYVVFENSADGRVYASAKKNSLMREMKNPRMAVLHSRIVLDPGALAATPREFDILSPNTQTEEHGVRQPYLSLVQTDAMWPGRMPRTSFGSMRSAGGDPLLLHERGPVFVDGGGFFVTKRVQNVCPMADEVAWGEYEDMEWCARAFLNGFVSDIALGATARSQTSKLHRIPRLGPAARPAMATVRALRGIRSGARHYTLRAAGRR